MRLLTAHAPFAFLITLTFVLTPLPVFAGNTPIGAHCSEDGDCATGECEDSDLDIADDDFCVCEEDAQCAAHYNTQPGETWECEDGDDESADVNFCLSNQRGKKTVVTVNKKPIGTVCESNSECITGDCESSDQKTSFCDCTSDNQCGEIYGTQNGETWTCEDGTDASQDLDFCSSNQRGNQMIDVQAGIAAANAGNTTFEDNVKPFALVKPTLQIPLPDLEFSEGGEAVDESGSIAFTVNWIAQYFKAIYLYLLGLVGLIAVIVFIHAGLEYMTSGGNGAAIKDAKSRMLNAVVGIFVLFGGYAILHAINPALTRFSGIQVSAIKRVALDLKGMEEFADERDEGIEPPSRNGFNGVPVYKQGDTAWARVPYGKYALCSPQSNNDPPNCNSSYTFAGCGPTSLAMVLRYYGVPVDPVRVGAYNVSTGARGKSGTSSAMVDPRNIQQFMPGYVGKAIKPKEALELLHRKIPIIATTPDVGKPCFTKGGHWIVLTGVDEQGIIRVNDPAGGTKCVAMKDDLAARGFFFEQGASMTGMTQQNFNNIPFMAVVAPEEILQSAEPVS